jgi:tRNA nucleotidyltransferase (CCA-adding enzyme)
MKLSLNKVDFSPSKEDVKELGKESKDFIKLVKQRIKKLKFKADVFVGGSFAKGTLIRSSEYDVDIFIRFHKDEKDISAKLEKILSDKEFKKRWKTEKVHGSRDYFRAQKGKVILEAIPVKRISKTSESENVTDLSFFHVKYLNKKMNSKIAREITLAKKFCKAQGVYGAESYINGFSGYGLECLIIYYKSFEKMIKDLVKVDSSKKKIIDLEKSYKKKEEILIGINESKLKSPIVLIDPTWKERNVLAALNEETFVQFKQAAQDYLKNPSLSFFEEKDKDWKSLEETARKENYEFLHIQAFTDKQPGDIAGTKLKKFSRFIKQELSEYFEIKGMEFVYNDEYDADIYVSVKSKGEVIKDGPPVLMKEYAAAFRAQNPKAYEKEGKLYSVVNVDFTAKQYLQDYYKKYQKQIRAMDITKIETN